MSPSEDGGYRVLARSRQLVDTETQIMLADEFYDGKPLIDISEIELKKGLTTFAGVDVQQTSDVDFCRQIFRVVKMDASVPVDSRVFMQQACPAQIPCLLYTSPSPRDATLSRMPSSA